MVIRDTVPSMSGQPSHLPSSTRCKMRPATATQTKHVLSDGQQARAGAWQCCDSKLNPNACCFFPGVERELTLFLGDASEQRGRCSL